MKEQKNAKTVGGKTEPIDLEKLFAEQKTEAAAQWEVIKATLDVAKSTVIGIGLTGVVTATLAALANHCETYKKEDIYSNDVNLILELTAKLEARFKLGIANQKAQFDNQTVEFSNLGFYYQEGRGAFGDDARFGWTSKYFERIPATRAEPEDVAEHDLVTDPMKAKYCVIETFKLLLGYEMGYIIHPVEDC